MSKSIYEEALKESKDFGAFVGLRLDRVNNALEQAQKQEKLLELYKELATLYRDKFDYTDSASEIQRLWVKIKELENDNRSI